MIRLYLLGQKAYAAFSAMPYEWNRFIHSVVVAKDKNLTHDYNEEIFREAEQRGIKSCTRKDSREAHTEYAIAIGWRWLIDLHTCGKLIVFHDSLLPRYRGFNPLVTALINGDKKLGVTALLGEKTFDSGEIVKQWSAEIQYPLKIQAAIDVVAEGYAVLLREVIESIYKKEKLETHPQEEEEVTYSVWRDENDYLIDWRWDVERIKRFIDAVGNPYMGAQCYLRNERIKILDADIYSLKPVENPGFGKVIMKDAGVPIVVTGKGLIALRKVCRMDNQELELPKNIKYRFE